MKNMVVGSIIGEELRVLLEYREGKKASSWMQVLVDVIVSFKALKKGENEYGTNYLCSGLGK